MFQLDPSACGIGNKLGVCWAKKPFQKSRWKLAQDTEVEVMTGSKIHVLENSLNIGLLGFGNELDLG